MRESPVALALFARLETREYPRPTLGWVMGQFGIEWVFYAGGVAALSGVAHSSPFSRGTTAAAHSTNLEALNDARQYFTTTFMKEELAKLSRARLYIAILTVSTPIALLLNLTAYAGPSPPVPRLFSLAVLTVIVGLTPLALLISFVHRIATVAQHIAAITPFKM